MLIDANIFLEVLLEQEKSNLCKSFLREIFEGKKKASLSSITIDSIVFVMLKNELEGEKVGIFLKSLLRYKGLKIYQIKIKDRINALLFMKRYKLDYEDALVLQCALSNGCETIVSFDKHFEGLKEIKRVEPEIESFE